MTTSAQLDTFRRSFAGAPRLCLSGAAPLAVEAVATGTVSGPFVVATDARRKEVYLASYDASGRRRSEPVVDKPAALATDGPVVGEGAVLYPTDFPNAVAPQRPDAAWLARAVVEHRVELLPLEPLYLRRPDAEVPRPPKVLRNADTGS